MNRHHILLALGLAFFIGCTKAPVSVKPGGGGGGTSPAGSSGGSGTNATPGGGAAPNAEPKLIDFSNGLGDADREEFYHTGEGSEAFPLKWLKVLENSHTGKRFLDDVARFGLIRDDHNSDGLPIGLTKSDGRGLDLLGPMVGVNCAGCHVGQISYKGRSIRLDGGPNLFDARKFFTELADSAEATIKNPLKLIAFLHRLHQDEADDDGTDDERSSRSLVRRLVTDVAAGVEALDSRVKQLIESETATDEPKHTVRDELALHGKSREHVRAAMLGDSVAALGELGDIAVNLRLLRARVEFAKRLAFLGGSDITEGGPGRVDAFGTARYWLFDDTYKPNTPVSYPAIFGFEQIFWLHYDGNTTSVIERNIGQSLGLGAVFEKEHFSSTVIPQNLNRLEVLAAKLTPPAWPEQLFGKIDSAKAARGKATFETNCKSCHPPIEPGGMAQDLLVKLEDVGTDRGRAITFTDKLPSGEEYVSALAGALARIKAQAYIDRNVSPEDQQAFERNRPVMWRAPGEYAGRPLRSIWASAPYLHNASVPTLHDLLSPADQRPKSFPLGHREYDPIKVGYTTKVDGEPVFTFDVTKPGNSNVGHEYGADLSESDRMELLEYLKTL